jgi:hypothetical protein
MLSTHPILIYAGIGLVAIIAIVAWWLICVAVQSADADPFLDRDDPEPIDHFGWVNCPPEPIQDTRDYRPNNDKPAGLAPFHSNGDIR